MRLDRSFTARSTAIDAVNPSATEGFLMFAIRLKYRFLPVTLAASVVTLLVADNTTAQVIYHENFDDEMLEPNTGINNVTIANGIASFNDPATARATFSVVQDFTNEVMTFSFDIVAPVVEAPPRMELLFRAGIGTAQNTLQSGDQIVEAIMYRTAADPTRGDYLNNGNESIFLVANNKASDLTFTSPIDGVTPVTLTGFQYIPYVKDNNTGTFGQVKGISNYTAALMANWGTFNRFGIGSSTTGDVGTFAIDNVAVSSGVNFEGFVEPPGIPGDTNGNMIGGEFPDDFDPIKMNFRKAVTSRAQGDLVRDNVVDFKDFREWKAAFLAAGGSLDGIDFSFTTTVPEPATGWLLTGAACALFCHRRFRPSA
jgi:hypothetical protein